MAVKELRRGQRYRIDWLDEFGRRHRKVIEGSKTEARDALQDRRSAVVKRRRDLRRLGQGLTPRHAESLPTFCEFVQARFLRDYRGRGVLRSTYYADVLNEDGAIMATFGETRIDRITRTTLEEFRRKREAEGRSPSTVRKNLTVIGTVLNYAVECRLLLHNPVLGMKKPPEPKRRDVHLSDADYERLKAEVVPWVRRFVRFAGETGLRLGEIRRLQPKHLDLAAGFVHVPEAGKTGTRPVPLTVDARAVIEELRAQRRERIRELGRIEPEADYLFTNEAGNPYTRENEGQLGRSIKRALERMGVEIPPRQGGLRLLRHTFASRLIQRGVHLVAVQDLLGHADPKTTRRYAHLAPADLKAAVSVLEAPGDTSDDTADAESL